MVLCTQYYLRGPVKPRLNIREVSLVYEHTSSKIYNFDADFRVMFHENIFRFEITVDDSQFLEKGQRSQQLNGKGSYIMHIKGPEVVGLEQLVEVGGKELSDYAYVLSENDEVFYPQQVLTVLYVLLFDLHQDVYLIQGQLHVLPSSTHDLHSHSLPSFMVKGLHHFSKGPSPKSIQQLIAVPHLLVLLPNVPTLKVVLTYSRPDSDVVHCLLINQLDSLVLRQHRLKFLQYFFSREARERSSQVFIIKKLRLLDQWYFFLNFLEIF